MEYILTAGQMKQSDSLAINEYGIESLVLMERAAYETACIIIDKFKNAKTVGIMAGSGNNGGDGIAVARILNEAGIKTEINLIGDVSKLTRETSIQLETAKKLNIPINYDMINTSYDVIVDAIFGIGITRDAGGRYAQAIEAINSANTCVVAVDIPSGINADNGKVMGTAVKANITVTFQFRKLGITLYPGAGYAGDVYCVPIGIPRAVVGENEAVISFTNPKVDLKLPVREPSGNKGSFGKALIIAGSASMGGACILSSLSAYRMGTGMVRVFTANENRDILLRRVPEAIIDTYSDDKSESITDREKKLLSDAIKWSSVVAIGPGLSTSKKALSILKSVFDNCDKPLVVDADALNLLSQNRDLLQQLEHGKRKYKSDIVMTPHLGELSRLMDMPIDNIKEDILTCAGEFADKYDVTIVCKDARTVVAKRANPTYINTSGNEGMATAGSGDVLTGIIASLIAQGENGYEAAKMGVYIHGLSGDIAKSKTSSYFMTAQDIITSLRDLGK